MTQITNLLWCKQDGHDKIWISLVVNDHDLMCAWGKRGAKLQFKHHTSKITIDCLAMKKVEEEGYVRVGEPFLSEVFPNLIEKIEMDLTLAIMEGKVK